MNWRKIAIDASIILGANLIIYFAVKRILSNTSQDTRQASEKALKMLKRTRNQKLKLTEHEIIIAAQVIDPEDIPVNFSDIAGLDLVVESLLENVIYPLRYPKMYSGISDLLSAPKGVLLYGPPGTGKTMIAKALAKESGATFINLHVSTLTDKWFGESQKLVNALFSLALKLAPTIIFIDEIDSFLRERKSFDHEAMSMMKAEFMSLWDGLAGLDENRVIVLGATNRPHDIDKAILRRMPKRFPILLPDAKQRREILELLLKNSIIENGFDLDVLVDRTEGFSGSDIKEMCKNAVMVPVRESVRKLAVLNQKISKETGKKTWLSMEELKGKKISVRAIKLDDFYAVQSGEGMNNEKSFNPLLDMEDLG